MTTIQFLKKSKSEMHEKFSGKKFLKFVKVIKPILKIMWRKHRTNAVTPSTCNYDVVESFQNDINESELFQLNFKFFDCSEGKESEENLRNEELEKRLMETKPPSDEGEKDLRLAVGGKTDWTPRSDADICEREVEYVTWRQRAEQQVPVAII